MTFRAINSLTGLASRLAVLDVTTDDVMGLLPYQLVNRILVQQTADIFKQNYTLVENRALGYVSLFSDYTSHWGLDHDTYIPNKTDNYRSQTAIMMPNSVNVTLCNIAR